MGTPIRPVDMILSEHKVDAADLEVADRFAIMLKLRQRFSSHLKYMPGFNEIRDMTNKNMGNYDRRETDHGVIQFATTIFDHTRCLHLATILYKASDDNPAGSGFGCHYVEQVELLLTQDGEFIKWQQKYRRYVEHGLGYRSHRSGIREVAEVSTFLRVSENDLQVELADVKVFTQVLHSIRELVRKCVEEREARLGSMKHLEQFTDTVLIHINGHPYF